MKKANKIISMILACTTLFSFVSCAEKNSEGGDLAGTESVLLADFEQYVPDIELIRIDENFGKISLNKDKQFVKSGDSSAKIQPLGQYTSGSYAIFVVPFLSENYSYDYTDARYLSAITMSIYNAENTVQNLKLGMEVNESDPTTNGVAFASLASPSWYELKPGWNDIIYYPNLEELDIAFDVSNILGLGFVFDDAGSRNLADAPVLYLDALKLHRTKKAKEIKNVIELDKNEILGFEKEWQNSAFYSIAPDPVMTPDTSIIVASTEGIEATQGEKVLKCVMKPHYGWGNQWAQLRIPAKIMRASGFMNFSDQEIADYVIAYDCCARKLPTATGYTALYVELYSADEDERSNYLDAGNMDFTEEWKTIRIPLGLCRSAVWKNPGELRLVWSDYPPERGPLTVYFDNFRIEKISRGGV